MIRFAIILLSIISTYPCFGQTSLEFGDSQKATIEGVDFGYTVSDEKVKQVDGSEYLFLTIDWYATNKERFSKVFVLDDHRTDRGRGIDLMKVVCIARIEIKNAIGEKTSAMIQETNVEMNVFKEGILLKKNAKIKGYKFDAGQTIYGSISVKILKDKKPDVSLIAFLSNTY